MTMSLATKMSIMLSNDKEADDVLKKHAEDMINTLATVEQLDKLDEGLILPKGSYDGLSVIVSLTKSSSNTGSKQFLLRYLAQDAREEGAYYDGIGYLEMRDILEACYKATGRSAFEIRRHKAENLTELRELLNPVSMRMQGFKDNYEAINDIERTHGLEMIKSLDNTEFENKDMYNVGWAEGYASHMNDYKHLYDRVYADVYEDIMNEKPEALKKFKEEVKTEIENEFKEYIVDLFETKTELKLQANPKALMGILMDEMIEAVQDQAAAKYALEYMPKKPETHYVNTESVLPEPYARELVDLMTSRFGTSFPKKMQLTIRDIVDSIDNQMRATQALNIKMDELKTPEQYYLDKFQDTIEHYFNRELPSGEHTMDDLVEMVHIEVIQDMRHQVVEQMDIDLRDDEKDMSILIEQIKEELAQCADHAQEMAVITAETNTELKCIRQLFEKFNENYKETNFSIEAALDIVHTHIEQDRLKQDREILSEAFGLSLPPRVNSHAHLLDIIKMEHDAQIKVLTNERDDLRNALEEWQIQIKNATDRITTSVDALLEETDTLPEPDSIDFELRKED